MAITNGAQPKGSIKASSSMTASTYRKSVVKKSLGKEASEVEVDGQRMFANLNESDNSRLNTLLTGFGTLLESHGMDILRLALKLAQEMGADSDGERMNIVEILHAILGQHNDDQRRTEAFMTIGRNVLEFVASLRTDIKIAMSIAKIAELPAFQDPLRAVFHYRKHGQQFPTKTWNPKTQPFEVLLREEPVQAEDEELNLVLVQYTPDGACKKFYIRKSNDQLSLVIERPGQPTIASMFQEAAASVAEPKEPEDLDQLAFDDQHLIDQWNPLEAYLQDIHVRVSELSGYAETDQLNIFVTLEDGERSNWEELKRRWTELNSK